MLNRNDPGAVRWLMGGELARLRERSGLSMKDVASKTGLTKTKLNHLESGRSNQTAEDIAEILTVCQAPQAEIDRLTSLASMPHGKPWWNQWREIVTEWYGLYIGLEGLAVQVTAYELVTIHGLLQTRHFAEAISSDAVLVRPDDAARVADLRMTRTERLVSEPLLAYTCIIDESALLREVASDSIMIDQFEHLLAMSELPNVTLQIMPMRRTLHAGASMGNYAILDFEGFSSVAFAEFYNDALFIRDPDKLRSYRLAAEHSSATALSSEESRKMIKKLATKRKP